MAGGILEFVNFQLVAASSSTLSIDFLGLCQQSHTIAYFDCIDVEVTVFLPVQIDSQITMDHR